MADFPLVVRPLPGDAWIANAGTKPRRVLVLDVAPGLRYQVVYGTSKPPWDGCQDHDQWTLLLHLSPGDYPELGLTEDTFFYAETVEDEKELPDFIRKLGMFDLEVWDDVRRSYIQYLKATGLL